MRKERRVIYERNYREKHRKKINGYNRIWMREYRECLKTGKKKKKKKVPGREKNVGVRETFCIKDDFCKKCGIRLTSQHTTKGNKTTCGDCLKKLNTN